MPSQTPAFARRDDHLVLNLYWSSMLESMLMRAALFSRSQVVSDWKAYILQRHRVLSLACAPSEPLASRQS